MKICPDVVYIFNKDVAYREIERQILFLRPKDSLLYTLNDTGRFIWHGITKKKNLTGIINDFSKEFHIPKEQAEKDVSRFISDLEKKKIIIKKT